ncbi:MAG: hypothetical protein AAGE92_13415, partial [Cyanobacteria bacterium P01_G01_bin.4]
VGIILIEAHSNLHELAIIGWQQHNQSVEIAATLISSGLRLYHRACNQLALHRIRGGHAPDALLALQI